MALTDNTGTVQASYTYEPFGGTGIAGSPGSNNFDYTGRESDVAGLKSYRARYYHPGLARFISEDPIGLQAGETNFYAYVGSNPLRFIDPLGLDKEGPFEEPGLGTPWLDPIDLIGGVGGLTTKLIGKVAAKQASKAVAHSSLRRVGDILESVDDIVANPELIRGLTPTDVVARLGRLPARWTVGTLGRGSRAGQGWVLREVNTAGNLTGRAMFWHPGAGHHGAGAYWKVSSPQGGIVRVFK